ncbi:SpoIIE family protein phosphatase [Streptomyces sp. NPDC048845]|uniref:ATP-binding SpoIIE family protein phosphatase n=1 Tax=Streptomyces sp. NPDC048845 TaxID=3155390 RepID=UPI00343FDEAF
MDPTLQVHEPDQPSGGVVVLLLDEDGTVLQCPSAAFGLTGRTASELRGRPFTELVPDPDRQPGRRGGPGEMQQLRTVLLHRDGTEVPVDAAMVPLPDGCPARHVVCLSPAPTDDNPRHPAKDRALLRAMFEQNHFGLVVHGTDLGIERGTLNSCLPGGFVTDRPPPGARLSDAVLDEDAAAIEEQLRRVLETGEPVIDWEQSARPRRNPGEERMLSMSVFRLHDGHGRALGVAAVYTDVTTEHAARRRLRLLQAAAERLGQNLDVTGNAEELAEILVPSFADLVSVDLSDSVFEGQETGAFVPGTRLRRIAVASADGRWPAEIDQLGDVVRAREQESFNLREGTSLRVEDLESWRDELDPDEERRRLLFPDGATSAMFVPLHARGAVLGVMGLWRRGERARFAEDDVSLIEEIASRAALSLENARRYTTELRTVEMLQRSLLPPAGVDLSAAETAGTYIPASTAAGMGGSWYDVIPLSSARVAFVIGDVVGHGLGATATMGRLRTAVQTLADLDMAPEELLTHLDDLVIRLGSTEPQPGNGGVLGTTCLYCVYDPVTGRCSMASAGHPPPLLTCPGGPTHYADLKPGPALGSGGMPFEPLDLHLTPGSVLAFYTNKLVVHGGRPAGAEESGGGREGAESGEDRERAESGGGRAGDAPEEPDGCGEQPLRPLVEGVATAVERGGSPAEIGRAALDQVLTEVPADDVALLVARVRALDEGSTAAWRFTDDPAVVSEARELVINQLTTWGLDQLTFTTELIVSELITNAIRYAGAPIGLRLIKDRTLICEVSDPSQTQPHLRRARLTDEGGRGLFLIAQLAHRWGSRYTHSGKTIWTEQPLNGVPEVPLDLF